MEESAAIHDRSRVPLSAVDQHGGFAILENPSTSMTFDDPIMVQWAQTVTPFAAQASACQFGKDWAKTWMFVANREAIFAVAKSCPHSHGGHQRISGVRMADGTFFSRLTAGFGVHYRPLPFHWQHCVAPGQLEDDIAREVAMAKCATTHRRWW